MLMLGIFLELSLDFVIRLWFRSKILAVKREVMFTRVAYLSMHVSLCLDKIAEISYICMFRSILNDWHV